MGHRGFGVWRQWRHICLLLQTGENAQKAGTDFWFLFLLLLAPEYVNAVPGAKGQYQFYLGGPDLV